MFGLFAIVKLGLAFKVDALYKIGSPLAMLNSEHVPIDIMSEELLSKLRERKARLDKELTEKVSKDYNDLMGKVHDNIESLRQGNKDFYTQKAQQELDKWEQAIKSGNTITAVSHKMMAETYLALARTL